MSTHTRSQQLAQAAFPRVHERYALLPEKPLKEYVSFAKKFPALVHTCGLAQAVAFARAQGKGDYLADLAAVLQAAGHTEITPEEPLDEHSREQPLSSYLRLSRDALAAAGWLKRYAEAAGEGD